MPVDSKHASYAGIVSRAAKVRDFVSGDVKGYVLKLPGHKDDPSLHELYAARAKLLHIPAVPASVDAYVGMIMTPEPVVTGYPEGFSIYIEDLTFDGEPLARVTGRIVRELFESARCVVVVDYPETPEGSQLTQAQAEAMGLRAYARVYKAEDLIDWRVSSKGGERYISQLRLQEPYTYTDPDDEWQEKSDTQIRVLDYDGDVYRVRVFRKSASGQWEMFSEARPTANGRSLDVIPAVVFGPSSLDPSLVDRPPVQELVDLSDGDLNLAADHAWGLLWCGSPTPVFSGLQTDDELITLGAAGGIRLGEGGAASFLALGSDGVGAIAAARDRQRQNMAAVGARLLQDEGSTQIATETAIIQRAGEHSVLANVANTVADGMKKVLGYLSMWAGVEADISVSLNTDFLPTPLTPDEMRSDMEAVQNGFLSTTDLFEKWQMRGAIRTDKTFEDHQSEIEDDASRVAEADMGGQTEQGNGEI